MRAILSLLFLLFWNPSWLMAQKDSVQSKLRNQPEELGVAGLRIELMVGYGWGCSKVQTGIALYEKKTNKVDSCELDPGGGVRFGLGLGYASPIGIEYSVNTGVHVSEGYPKSDDGIIRWTSFFLEPCIGYQIKTGRLNTVNLASGLQTTFASQIRIDARSGPTGIDYIYRYKTSMGLLLKGEFEQLLGEERFSFFKVGLRYQWSKASFESGSINNIDALKLDDSTRWRFENVDLNGFAFYVGIGTYF